MKTTRTEKPEVFAVKKKLWIGQPEGKAFTYLRANLPQDYAGIMEPPVISPGMTLSSARRLFRLIGLARQGSVMVQLGSIRPDGSTHAMSLPQQDLLLPFVDEFEGSLLLFYSPFFLPVLPALRSRLDMWIVATRKRGRPENPYVLMSRLKVGRRAAVQRSYQASIADIEAYRGSR